jgi:hypothetical protein
MAVSRPRWTSRAGVSVSYEVITDESEAVPGHSRLTHVADRQRGHVRQAQVDDVLDSTKSGDSERILVIDRGTADVLKAWRKASSPSGWRGRASGPTAGEGPDDQ